MLLANFTLRNTPVEHFVQMVRIRVHEDRLTGAAGERLATVGLALMFSIESIPRTNGEGVFREEPCSIHSRWWNRSRDPISPPSAQGSEEGTVRRTGMHSVQSVDDVHTLLEWPKASMGSGNFALAKDPLFFMPAGMAVAGSKPWFCMKKITRLGLVLKEVRLGPSQEPTTSRAAKTGRHSLHHFLRSMYITSNSQNRGFYHILAIILDNIDKLILTKVEASIGAEVGL